jgi:hypothetical protein
MNTNQYGQNVQAAQITHMFFEGFCDSEIIDVGKLQAKPGSDVAEESARISTTISLRLSHHMSLSHLIAKLRNLSPVK